jgi:1-pyrroline-5-carboxylate dehydrogenase
MSLSDFRNEPMADFALAATQAAMRGALAGVRTELGREYDLVIGGERLRTLDKIRSINPARPGECIGVHQKAQAEHIAPAMRAALAGFETWRFVSAAERAAWLFRVAAMLRERKFAFNAWLVLEVGKNWGEAEADTCEAIDFCELYARLALELDRAATVVQLPGERNLLRYLPLGVGAVIPPWNFPLAILVGMTVASVVAGNTVILKPSSDAPTIAAKFFEVMEAAGLPAGVVNLCPGAGATFGDGLVQHPQTRFIAFTGSRDVGLRIHSEAARPQAGQLWIKRTILEMGGKDSIIVASDADLDSAADGVCAAAFGFQGQKCSACSRVIVDGAVYEVFLDKLLERVARLRIGSPEENVAMGPVINEGAMESILRYIEIGAGEGRVVAGGKRVEGAGYCIEPTVIADVAPDARIAQEEIFGPVLAVIRARDFADALKIANNTDYGLTGAIYSRSPESIAQAERAFHVGNLYVNRKCTGAIVGAHPFGGFNMSGTDSKAGGADYLYLFTQAKSIAHKV